ncbi:hypothetical protein CsSME_00046238 [Camellia sinensis var. sinensis]
MYSRQRLPPLPRQSDRSDIKACFSVFLGSLSLSIITVVSLHSVLQNSTNMQKTAQAWFAGGPSSSNDLQKSSSLLAGAILDFFVPNVAPDTAGDRGLISTPPPTGCDADTNDEIDLAATSKPSVTNGDIAHHCG